MLSVIRRFLDTWLAKALLFVLVAGFGLWGVSGVIGDTGSNDGSTVARVGDAKIAVTELQDASRRLLAQFVRQNGGKITPTPEIRRAAAQQALQQLIIEAASAQEAARLHIAVPDDALRDEVFKMSAFAGTGGQFDRNKFDQVMRNTGLTEPRFLALMHNELAQRQLVEAVRAAGSSPAVLNRLVFAYQGEKRLADLVQLPFAGAREPPAPTPDQIERYYDDNLTAYAIPEQRRIKAVILTPDRLAQDITVTDADARAYYESHRTEFEKPDAVSVQIVIAPAEAAGATLAAAWKSGADWDTMQKQAAAASASAIELDDTNQLGFPSPDLAKAVFAATPETVTGPQKIDDGWPVFRVIKRIDGTHRSFEAAAAEVKTRVALEQARDKVFDNANRLQNELASGTTLDDKLPEDLGLIAVSGTLDATGDAPDGTPAPIPGPPDLRAALIAHAFQIAPNDPATLEDAGDGNFYAVTVESIVPPATQPLDAVKPALVADWTRAQRRHEQDVIAAQLLTAVKGGGSLADAAALHDLPVRRSQPISRGAPPLQVPRELTGPLFTLKPGEGTMVETPDGFTVATLVSIEPPDPASNPDAVDGIRTRLAGAMSDDLEVTFAGALRDREKVTVNGTLFDQAAQP